MSLGLGFKNTRRDSHGGLILAQRERRGGEKMVGAGGFEPPDGRSKVSWLTTCRRPKSPALGACDDQGRLLDPLLFVLHENPILDELTSLVVDGMRDVLIRPVRTLPA